MTVAIYDKNILLLKSKCQVDIKVRKFTMFIAAASVLFYLRLRWPKNKSFAHNSLCWVAKVFQHSKKSVVSLRGHVCYLFLLQSSRFQEAP